LREPQIAIAPPKSATFPRMLLLTIVGADERTAIPRPELRGESARPGGARENDSR
jgi:hypothetical protein